jgi:hypothetical protein
MTNLIKAMAHLHFPVLVDFWSTSTPTPTPMTLAQVWDALVEDYTGIASEITSTVIRQKLNGYSSLTYMKDEAAQKIMLRYEHYPLGANDSSTES